MKREKATRSEGQTDHNNANAVRLSAFADESGGDGGLHKTV